MARDEAAAKVRLRRVAFRLARSGPAGGLIRFSFAHLEPLVCATVLTTVARGERCAVYRHPVPSYGTRHQIAVPLVAVPDVLALAHPRHAQLRADLLALIEPLGAETSVLVNAGPRQDVGQVHFHLSDDPMRNIAGTGVSWPDWESAVCGLSGTPGLDALYLTGFSLLRRPGRTDIELV